MESNIPDQLRDLSVTLMNGPYGITYTLKHIDKLIGLDHFTPLTQIEMLVV